METLSRGKLIVLIIGGVFLLLVIVIVAFFIFSGDVKPPSVTPITLEFWGIFDDSDVYQPIIDAYHKKNPLVTINYRKFLWDDYEGALINAIASRRGPDIFMVHSTWLAKHKDKLAPIPVNSFPYAKNFLSATKKDFVQQTDTVYAFPLFVDNLALFYNRDLFAKEGFNEPPVTWEQFNNYVRALTRFSPDGKLIQSGAAIGSSSKTINRATDLFLALLLQNGIQPFVNTDVNNPDKREVSWKNDQKKLNAARDALRFYTEFADPSKEVYTWNDKQEYSIDAFYEGNVAMIFNFAYNIPVIKAKAPYLNFGVAPLPQKGGSEGVKKVTVSNYWGAGVSLQSKRQNNAWDFLSFLTSKDQYAKYIQTTGRISARPDIMETQKDDPLLKPFILQAQYMLTPFQPDEKKLQNILDEMITSINAKVATLDQALRKAESRLQLLIQ